MTANVKKIFKNQSKEKLRNLEDENSNSQLQAFTENNFTWPDSHMQAGRQTERAVIPSNVAVKTDAVAYDSCSRAH